MPRRGRSEMTIHPSFRTLVPACAGSVLWITASCAQTPPAAASTISPVPPNQARIWFYRDLNPYDSLATPFVRLNGAAIGVSQPGGAFYRDVPPGHYHISADSYLDDPNQDRDVDLAPRQEIYAKVLPS